MLERDRPHALFLFAAAALALSAAALAQTNTPPSDTRPNEIRIVSTEFRFEPAEIRVMAGQEVTLVLDNREGETEHDLCVTAFGFRLPAKAGEIARAITVFEKPGEYEFGCDLPGHREAGMKGTLIVGGSSTGR